MQEKPDSENSGHPKYLTIKKIGVIEHNLELNMLILFFA